MAIFNSLEQTRYARHFALPQIGIAGQAKLKAAKVVCVGAGGLGSPALLYLAAAGIGQLGIVEDDVVELSNLQRQILYTTDDLQKKKADAAIQHLHQLNPEVSLISHPVRLTHENALEILSGYDYVVDGTDNFSSRYLINDACFHLKKPLIYGSISQFQGLCTVFNAPGGPCYRCLYDTPPPANTIQNCAEGGVLGILPGLIGSLQALEVMKLILEIGEPLIGKCLIVDALTLAFKQFILPVSPECRLCAKREPFDTLPDHTQIDCQMNTVIPEITVKEFYAQQQQPSCPILLDVRETFEYEICHLGGKLIPLSQLPHQVENLDKNQSYVVHCKSGGRSAEAVRFLQQCGFVHVKNLKGGIVAWHQEIDSTISLY